MYFGPRSIAVSHEKKRKLRQLCDQVTIETDPTKLLNMFLELDRLVVERSLHLYKVPHRQRFVLRQQNRQLHAAIRRHRSAQSNARKMRAGA